jgi:hypothetical protein
MLKRFLVWRRGRAIAGRSEPDLQRCLECGLALALDRDLIGADDFAS